MCPGPAGVIRVLSPMAERKIPLALAAALVAAFGLLSAFVPGQGPALFDAPVLEAVGGARSGPVTWVASGLTRLGGFTVLTPLVAVAAVLLVRRCRRAALLVVAATAGAALLDQALKHAFAAFLLALVLVARELWPLRARLAAASALLVALAIGLTRIYLGVHYPTDVLGGWLAGSAWTLLLYAAMWPRRPGGPAFDSPTAGR